MEPPMSPSPKRREGFALAVAMVAIVVIGALIAGAFFTSTQEYRIGRNSLVDQRAYTAAEAGVTQPIQGWLKSLNLTMTNGATNNPDTLADQRRRLRRSSRDATRRLHVLGDRPTATPAVRRARSRRTIA